ncbi:uncharacterized protein [Diabrotica undecimpunctata]|uniref:uncharacterized protein n=1 Tax=Diabrotica undecimpunctata TaxID=50387 RepID=UPI003B6400DB
MFLQFKFQYCQGQNPNHKLVCLQIINLIIQLLDRDMYVDDLITGISSEEQGTVLCNQVSQISVSASFNLRKWVSTSIHILNGLQGTSDILNILELGENDRVKTLGIQWMSVSNLLSYKVAEHNNSNQPITKRIVVRSIARIYYPLSLISPCIIFDKILIQQLWTQHLDWDDELPWI